jgi:hypothetical protein
MLRRRWVILSAIAIVLCSGAPWPSVAQQGPSPEALRAANEIVSLLYKGTFEQLKMQIWPETQASFPANIDAATRLELQDEFDRALTKLLADIQKDGEGLYARNFSAEELNDIMAFYRTPTGAKAMSIMPRLTVEFTTKLVMPRLSQLQREWTVTFEHVLMKHGYR